MEKLNKFVEGYDCTQFDSLPKFMKRRVDALKKIQLDYIQIQNQYHKELQELELKYEKLYQPLYEKRFKITSGEHEPTDEECQLPASVVENDFDGDQENSVTDEDEIVFTEEEETSLKAKVKGLPGYWLGCLNSSYNFSNSIEECDRPVLKHLNDIRLSYTQENESLIYKLEFHFDENPYFSNQVLTKTYYLKLRPDEKDPFSYEGFEVCKSEGCEINWKAGKDITITTKTVKQQNKVDGRTREKKKEVECDSFFYFFKPPKIPAEGSEDEIDEDLGSLIALDFELGEVVRQTIIPKSVLYYIGYMCDEDDDDDEDDVDDESDLEFDDSDDDSDDESNDSLNNGTSNNDKKRLVNNNKSPKKST